VEQLRRWRAAENTVLRTRIKAGVLEYVNRCGTEYLPTISMAVVLIREGTDGRRFAQICNQSRISIRISGDDR
jgi:hypothetical protein